MATNKNDNADYVNFIERLNEILMDYDINRLSYS